MKVEWSALALSDLESVVDYYAEFGDDTARRTVEPILKSVAQLAVLPYIGAAARDLVPLGRYRHLVRGRYRIIYRVDEDNEVVIVLRVWDTRQDPHRLESGE